MLAIAMIVMALSGVHGGRAFGQGAESFELVDGDRVVFLGDTFAERAQRHGFIEQALSSRWPERRFTFRNLGWSGDNVYGEARAYFGTVNDGFAHLKKHVYELDPTVLFISYGAMASFEGRAGLDRFVKGYHRLLDELAGTGARLILFSPIPHEDLGRPLPDPAVHNRNRALYTEAIRKIARERGALFIDLFRYLKRPKNDRLNEPLTDNGVHLTAYGYWLAAAKTRQRLGTPYLAQEIAIDAKGDVKNASGVDVQAVAKTDSGYRLDLKARRLALPPVTGHVGRNLKVTVEGLSDGLYTLRSNGRDIATHGAVAWAQGVRLKWQPGNDQATQLNEAINRKNQFFFFKWRPQNETYLRGFRKHEQGQNAAELPMFDPFIESLEHQIHELKQPRTYRYELVREGGQK
ncbi:MAG: SGNH/GDSL hydrolase family protein [Planctomycetota bacterium]